VHAVFSCRKYDSTRIATGLTPEDINGEEEGTEKLYAVLTETGLIKTHNRPQ
jgi:hypothetical protein